VRRGSAEGHPFIVLAVVFLFILFAVTTETVPPPPKPKPGPPVNAPLAIVSLGDSTMSGEGAGDFDPATNGRNGDWCHRSGVSEIHETRVAGVEKAVNLACSGAGTAQVGLGTAKQYGEGSQAAQLGLVARKDRVVAVVVAVGANDEPHFAEVLNACVQAWASQGSCSAGFESQWQKRIDAMVPKVVKTLRDIQKVMAGAGYSHGDYQLVLQSYAAPIGPDIASNLLGLAGCPFREVDLKWVRTTAVKALDTGLRNAADQAGTRFLDLARAGVGHEACSGGADPSNEWFTRLTVAWQDITNEQRVGHALQQSFHPNARGQAAFGNCLGQFLATTDRAAACLPGARGVLHPAALVSDG
jgi:lysophospholipase L1-like esterase